MQKEAHDAGAEEFLGQLRRILLGVGVSSGVADKLDWNTDFFQEGILDSVSLVATAVNVEKTFGFTISSGDFDPMNFTTPKAVFDLVRRQSRQPLAGAKA